jgi:TonB family protein
MMNVLEPTFTATNETVTISDFLQENLDYPKNATKAGVEGTVVIQFKVLPSGDLSEIQVVNSVCPDYDDAVTKAIEATTGMWNPGTDNGHPVTMEKEVSVVFKREGMEMYNTAQYYAVTANKFSKKGNYKRAIKLYNKAIVICPNCAFTFYQRGLARYNSGDQEGAKKDFERTADMGSHKADHMLDKLHEEGTYAQK